jgi:hypothetical protein
VLPADHHTQRLIQQQRAVALREDYARAQVTIERGPRRDVGLSARLLVLLRRSPRKAAYSL